MQYVKASLLLFVCVIGLAASINLQEGHLRSQFATVEKFVTDADVALKKYNLEDISVECRLSIVN